MTNKSGNQVVLEQLVASVVKAPTKKPTIWMSLCYRIGTSKNPKCTDISGEVFGRLTAIKVKRKSRSRSGYEWQCLCECGKTYIVHAANLKSGAVKSCGCLRRGAVLA